MDGNIIVDGILASCYIASHNDLAHIFMAPIRRIPEAAAWIFGEDSGFSAYVKINEHLGDWFMPGGLSYGRSYF